jgi:hypothetical protein
MSNYEIKECDICVKSDVCKIIDLVSGEHAQIIPDTDPLILDRMIFSCPLHYGSRKPREAKTKSDGGG